MNEYMNGAYVIAGVYFLAALCFTPVAIAAALTNHTFGWRVTMRTVGWAAVVILILVAAFGGGWTWDELSGGTP